jgi:acetoin utilization deacetylase AcuC-like enzyme
MTAERSIGVVHDPRYQHHRGPEGHPERPDRLVAVGEVLERHAAALVPVEARAASDEEILRAHAPVHLERIRAASTQAPTQLDPDTYLGPQSLSVAQLAAGGAIDLVAKVCRGELDTGLAAIRPPGHHAESDRAMGFCLLNNAAIAARAAQTLPGIERVLLIDWDVHHGNGVQHIFESDPSVLYVSSHQFPYYPGTGAFGEIGFGAGIGSTLNLPLPAGCGDVEYTSLFERLVVPAAHAYRPDLVLVSCGFDAHRLDPLAAMELSQAGFGALAACTRRLADSLCEGRLVLLLEGGYALEGLREGTEAVLEALRAPAPRPEPASLVSNGVIEAVVERVTHVHGKDFSDLDRL